MRRLRSWLCWAWLGTVLVYLVWGGIAQRGLYYWLGAREIDALGSYEPVLIGIVPGFLLGGPALWYLRREALRRPALDPAAGPVRLRRVAIAFGAAALAGLIALAAGLLLARQVPNDDGPALALDAAALGRGALPEGRVRIRAASVPGLAVTVAGGGRFRTADTVYRALRPEGRKDGPLGLFEVRREQQRSDGAILLESEERTGYLVEDGLPPLVRYALEARRARIAEPHFLIVGDGDRRTPYYVTAALGGFAAILFGLFAGMTLLLAERARVAGERGLG